jgi:pyruvate,water dikinase
MTDPTPTDDRLLWALQERAKELRCLYEIEELLNRPETPLEEVFQGVIRAVPPGWQYPEVCQASVEYEGRTHAPPGFVPTPWVQSADIVVQDRVVGRVNVQYTRDMPAADNGPFLTEEARLIRTIADRLGHYVLHQRMRTLVSELHDAQRELGEDVSEWRVAVQLLRRTDQELYVRLARKTANHLLWSGIPAAQELLQDLGIQRLREEEERLLGERNEPSARQPLDASLELADRVFELAGRHLPDSELLSRIQSWMHADRASFFVKAALDPRSAPGEVADAIRRYLHLVPQGTRIEMPLLANVRAALIRRFLSDEPLYVGVARRVLGLEDILELLDHLVVLPGGSGRVGGKAAGLFLASRLLREPAADGEAAAPVRAPRSWYVATDCSPAFVRYNNLEEMFEQKYKPTDEVRLQYPHVVQVFKNSAFPPELVRSLSAALDDLHEGPIVVRSSSLLEDRLGSAFSGKYKSLFLANRGGKRERLAALLDAIAEVYASIFGPDPIQYRAERGLLDSREEMGILLQEVVGTRIGRWYLPAYAGVAMSRNEFRWSSRIRREDGLLRLVPGLGTRAVDRIRDDHPVLIAPGQPGLRVNVTADEVLRYSPQRLDAVDLEAGALASIDIAMMLRTHGNAYPQIHRIVSELVDDRVVEPTGSWIDFETRRVVVTFEGLTGRTPFVSRMAWILHTLESQLGHPVEIEFASDGETFYLLQCRPQTDPAGEAPVPLPLDLPRERILFTANRYVSNGRVEDISHLVYVDPDAYASLADPEALRAVGRAVSKLNRVLPKRRFILMGPGRWGSRGDIKLGVNVTYSDISNTAVLVEVARRRGGAQPDLSFGTHFFQDLVEAKIRYLPLYPDDPGIVFDERFFRESPNDLAALLPEFAPLEPVVRVIDVARATGGKVLRVFLNADVDAAVGAFCDARESLPVGERVQAPPGRQDDHWRWRLRMAERIASTLDAGRFGVAALYLIGSVKNANAGPASDIDLLVHFRGDAGQKRELELWLRGWSDCLDETNFLRTGKRAGGLLDVHFVTDADLAARTSFAIKIGAVTDAALPLPLREAGR